MTAPEVPHADLIENAAREAFWADDTGGHIRGRWTWDTIPAEGQENYRKLVRAVLAALGDTVPERPQITWEQIRATVGPLVTNVMNYPEELSARMLGLDFSGLIFKVTDAIDALVNGADQP